MRGPGYDSRGCRRFLQNIYESRLGPFRGVYSYRIVTEGEVTTANSTKGSVAVVAVPWSLSDSETTRGIRGLVPGAILCTTAIQVSKYGGGIWMYFWQRGLN